MTIEQILRKLVSFETVTEDKKANKNALVWFNAEAKKSFPKLVTRWFENGGHSSLLITTRRTKKPVIWLVGHMDVVAAPKQLFKLRKSGNKLYGRGVWDMKGALACYLKLIQDLKGTSSEYDFGIMITTDEETGGQHGAKQLVKAGYTADVCFTPDGGEEWQLETKAKGMWQFRVLSRGVASHASRPWEGVNAIDQLSSFIQLVHKNLRLKGGPLKFTPTISTSYIHGGKVLNAVPDFAEAVLDLRFTSHKELLLLKKKVSNLANKNRDISVEDVLIDNEYGTSIKDHFLQKFVEAMPANYRNKQRGTFSHGSSDALYFSEKGIPTVVTRPKGGGIHRDDEWVDLKDLTEFYKAIKRYVLDISKISE